MLRFAVSMAVLVFASRVDAAELDTPVEFELRSLDAIHLATARELGDELNRLVTYDDRMVTAAKQLGYAIIQPR